ncbi:MAG TPA: serine hydrolase domain-containing protein [Streptosporangiaceae bacterium]
MRDGDTGTGGAGGAGPRTIFQVGSVTKLFTALLLADMAERGEVRLSDPAARYLPGARDAADPVTLADLATHTSGFPRLPAGLFWSARLSPRDPYARYPASWFRRAARRALRTGSGGSPYAYSNFGYGLLGYLLGRAAGSDYETLVATRVCGPLGLAATTFEVPGRSRDLKAQGYEAPAHQAPGHQAPGHQAGRPVPDWRMGALAGAGALYSTAADLARFLHACLAAADGAAPDGPLGPAIRAALAPRRPVPGGDIGLAWHHTRRGENRISWHNGMTGGFSAMVALDPDRGLGVAALANSGGRPPSPLDAAVMAALG